MSNEDIGYAQHNTGEKVFANQGGPQHNYADNSNVNSGSGQQYNYKITYRQLEEKYQGGVEGLKNRQYPKVVERFEDFLSSAESAKTAPGVDIIDRIARAHVYSALGLLDGSRPSYHSISLIRRIDRHLGAARREGQARPVAAMADVLLAIVAEDFYVERGMTYGGPDPAVLRSSLADLDHGDLEDLAKHIAPNDSTTWKELSRAASEAGVEHHENTSGQEEQRLIAPDRRMKVGKYFTKTPDHVSAGVHMAIFGGAGLMLLLAIVVHNLLSVVLVAAAGYTAKKGYKQYKRYREFLKAWAGAEPKPGEAELDAWLQEDIKYVTRKGGRRLQIKAREDFNGGDLITSPVVVVGIPDGQSTRNGKPPKARAGKDGEVRADHYELLIFFLTDQVISSYRCVLDFATGELLLDEARQYHYASVVGVSSITIPVHMPVVDFLSNKENDISAAQRFTLSFTSGETLQVTTQFSGGSFRESDGKIAWRGNDHALSIVQSEVRARNAR